MMTNRIITISREFGSGGRTIGKEVAARLGIHCYDSELIQKIAKESGYAEDFIKERVEDAQHKSWLANAFSGDRNFITGLSTQDYIWQAQRKVILDLAKQESCVIVGRCADYILSGHESCLKVFIHASLERRAERIVQVYGEREDSPHKRLKDKDQKRKEYYRTFTNIDWGQATNYHIALDSGVLGIPRCVDLLTQLY
jgi:cytidylate kinase